MQSRKKFLPLQSPLSGEMLEWLKRHAWKACVPQKGIASSNLALSAKRTKGRAKPVLERDFSFFLQSPPQAGEMSEGRQARRNLGERVCAVAPWALSLYQLTQLLLYSIPQTFRFRYLGLNFTKSLSEHLSCLIIHNSEISFGLLLLRNTRAFTLTSCQT